jgi:hypothetical protein
MRANESAGTPSAADGGMFWIVSVTCAEIATTGGGNVTAPLNPLADGNGTEVGEPPGVSDSGIVIVVLNG